MLTKSLGLTSDNVTYDLEDSVAEGQKNAARQALCAHLDVAAAAPGVSPGTRHNGSRPRRRVYPPDISELAVRINPVSSRHALADLTALGGALKLGHIDGTSSPDTLCPLLAALSLPWLRPLLAYTLGVEKFPSLKPGSASRIPRDWLAIN